MLFDVSLDGLELCGAQSAASGALARFAIGTEYQRHQIVNMGRDKRKTLRTVERFGLVQHPDVTAKQRQPFRPARDFEARAAVCTSEKRRHVVAPHTYRDERSIIRPIDGEGFIAGHKIGIARIEACILTSLGGNDRSLEIYDKQKVVTFLFFHMVKCCAVVPPCDSCLKQL